MVRMRHSEIYHWSIQGVQIDLLWSLYGTCSHFSWQS